MGTRFDQNRICHVAFFVAISCGAANAQHSISAPNSEASPSFIHLTQFAQQAIPGVERQPAGQAVPKHTAAGSAHFRATMPEDLFGSVDQVNRLPAHRRRRATSPGASAVFGSESKGRVTNDIGDLLKKAISSQGVTTQDRTPLVKDTRVRGQRAGQVLASGSFWTPVRSDLDTMMNKIDSRLVDDVIVIKGPYATRYGPGFRFVDFDLTQAPRFDGYESHGSTSFDYDTNGDQAYGRQTLFGGSNDWGYLVSYGHRTGVDYETGSGSRIPSSYKSRDLYLAIGWDLSDSQTLEFNYLRLDQTDLEFPGLVYDLNFLVTDGFEVKYSDTQPGIGDRLDMEVWYNATRFEGDTLNSGKAEQIPSLSSVLFSPSGTDGFAVTDARGSSLGYRWETTWGQTGEVQDSLGFDVTHVRQALNDVEPLIPDPDDNNFPVPPSWSVDVGAYWEGIVPITPQTSLTAGARVDFVTTDADEFVAGLPISVSDGLGTDSLHRDYVLWSTFLTSETRINDQWTTTFGVGHGERAPTLTELYAISSFIGSLQRGLTAIEGDPELRPERLTQIDLGFKAEYDRFRFGGNTFFSWVDDLITFDLLSPAGGAGGVGGFPQTAQYVNTEQAILAGFESYAELDVNPWLTTFGTLSYVEGRDLSRDAESRFGGGGRSGILGRDHESLPGLNPLESRLGLRLHDASAKRLWGLELSTRIVDNQDRVASSLEEIATPGFTTYDVRFFKRHQGWLFTCGIENITNKFYREHLDYRSGQGVFRPGVNFYSGVELTY
ncbi:MAG: TonB-dependent receptor [Fuerstiella sp.]